MMLGQLRCGEQRSSFIAAIFRATIQTDDKSVAV